jgi:PEGA domain
MVKSHHVRLRTAMVLSLAFVGMCGGCVERRYTVRTEPPGALVIVNQEALGPSPASHNFYYYGDREITLVLDGYETKTFKQPIKAPWWDNYLTEFFTENLVPYVIRDEREFTYKMEPYRAPTEAEIQGRAESLRSEAKVLPPPRRGGFLGWLGF